jgi:heme/copper-type cytochrome/quinol oxidase subunit 2
VLSTILHLLLAVILTVFLALQARSLVVVLRHRRARISAHRARPTDLFWTAIPVALVLFLAARSWVAVFGLEQPTMAAAITRAEPAAAPQALIWR